MNDSHQRPFLGISVSPPTQCIMTLRNGLIAACQCLAGRGLGHNEVVDVKGAKRVILVDDLRSFTDGRCAGFVREFGALARKW